MARYTGPRVRISRRFGVPIFGPTKYLERRNYGPGVHGPKSRRKHTDYGLGLIEKQKLRYYYGLLERQFRGVYERALKRRGVTGEQMLQILETPAPARASWSPTVMFASTAARSIFHPTA
jgi:small subunit ribosomal protein S4